MQKTISINYRKTISGAATLITTLILVTPLCGILFQCGCDWPWLGLDADCNFYKPGSMHQCPWCASKITGLLSTGLAVIGGVLTASTISISLPIYRSETEITVRSILGLTTFLLVAILTGGLAALWLDVSTLFRTHG